MPGSLLGLHHDAQSDRSDLSGRSTDSRTSGKKVSFNKAVRVKQYPWRPDEYQDGDGHLSIPSRRFWFKVYKSNSEQPQQGTSWTEEQGGRTTWGEEYTEDVHDSLTPIAEDEDQGLDVNLLHSSQLPTERPPMNRNQVKNIISRFNDESGKNNAPIANGCIPNGHPVDPPIDYIDEAPEIKNHRKNPVMSGVKAVLGIAHARVRGDKKTIRGKNQVNAKSGVRSASSSDPSNGNLSPVRTREDSRHTTTSIISRNGRTPLGAPIIRKAPSGKNETAESKLPRMVPGSQREESPARALDGNWSISTKQLAEERRMKTNGDNADLQKSLGLLKRVDKAVSTEDLATHQPYENGQDSFKYSRSHKTSQDKATQCTGTLTKSRNVPAATAQGVSRHTRPLHSHYMSEENQNNKNVRLVASNRSPNTRNLKVNKTEKSVNVKNSLGQSSNQISDYSQLNSKQRGRGWDTLKSNSKNFAFGAKKTDHKKENKQNNVFTPPTSRSQINHQASTTLPPLDESFIDEDDYNESTIPTSVMRNMDTSTHEINYANVPYEHKRDRETASGQLLWQSASDYRQDLVTPGRSTAQRWNASPQVARRVSRPPILRTAATVGHKYGRQMSSERYSTQQDFPVSNADEPNSGRNYLLTAATGASNAHNHRNYPLTPVDDSQSMIDWSLSGFQLGSRAENGGVTSSSDSECIVHRRPPLLMYIPGVSHHDRPAVDDDRLSAFSGMSKSEMEDELGPLSTSHTDRGHQGDIRRRHSMPKDVKMNWLKWKSNGKPSRQP